MRLRFVNAKSMDRKLKILLLVAVVALVLSWLYPPVIYSWQHNRQFTWHGYHFLFDSGDRVMLWRVDFARLALADGILVAVGGLLLILLRK
jgi:hypothetical protein